MYIQLFVWYGFFLNYLSLFRKNSYFIFILLYYYLYLYLYYFIKKSPNRLKAQPGWRTDLWEVRAPGTTAEVISCATFQQTNKHTQYYNSINCELG